MVHIFLIIFTNSKLLKKHWLLLLIYTEINFKPILLVFLSCIRWYFNLKIWYPVNYYNGQISESALISHHQCRLTLRRVQATYKVNFVRIEHVFFYSMIVSRFFSRVELLAPPKPPDPKESDHISVNHHFKKLFPAIGPSSCSFLGSMYGAGWTVSTCLVGPSHPTIICTFQHFIW